MPGHMACLLSFDRPDNLVHMRETRTDVHRPTQLITEDYEYVGCYDLGDSETPPTYHVPHGLNYIGEYGIGRCDHCGARVRYGAVLIHTPSGPNCAISVGETCLGNRFEQASEDFHTARKAAELDRKRQAIKQAWNEFRSTHEADWDALDASTNPFVVDVLTRGRRYGDLTPRQFEAVVAAVARDAERAAGRPEEIKAPAPEGRVTLTGEIVSVKEHESAFGVTRKMTVKVSTPEGVWLAWMTVPSGLIRGAAAHSVLLDGSKRPDPYDGLRGKTVEVTATLTRSDRDESFAFGKRPAGKFI
jgi:hypothetical protein